MSDYMDQRRSVVTLGDVNWAHKRIEELEAKLEAERGRIADLERHLKLWVPQNISETGRWPIRKGGE